MAKEKLFIFDTSLRDGEQSPGVTLTPLEKVEIARDLCRLGVDILEAGFPVASKGDFESVERIAMEVGSFLPSERKQGHMIICALARATHADIQCAYNAVKSAPKHRIHTFLATSDVHLTHKLKISRQQCLQKAVEAVTFARTLCGDVEFSPEDAGRSDPQFLCDVLSAVVEAGASTLNIPDTVGYNTPDEYGALISHLRANVLNADKVVWSTHCHNDLGLATANTLAGIQNGARQVEVTINGIGERAGNTSLEEIVMICYTRHECPVYTDVNTTLLYPLSQLVSRKTGMPVQPNKAIVGANAFAHESGIHQDGMLKHHSTYEIIQPQTVGVNATQLVLGKHSGRNGLRTRLLQLGYSTETFLEDAARFERLFERFKVVAEIKENGCIMDADLVALVEDELSEQQFDVYSVAHVQVVSNNSAAEHLAEQQFSSATVSILKRSSDGGGGVVSTETLVDAAIGKGPVNAIFQCINRILGLSSDTLLVNYEVKSVTEGKDALGRISVTVKSADMMAFQASSSHWDILLASAIAYVRAVGKMDRYLKSGASSSV